MKENKIFKYGMVVGRFQHIHIGHEKLIKIGLQLCDQLLVFVNNSSNSVGIQNPYEYEYRLQLIEDIFKEEIESHHLIITELVSKKNEMQLSPKWGRFVMEEAFKILGNKPECIIYGKDKNIFKCFDKEVIKNITEVIVDRNQMAISATQLRDYLYHDNQKEWEAFVNPNIHHEYKKLRELLLISYDNKNNDT